MKKLLLSILLLTLFIMIIFTFNMQKTYASRGCCSWHGGQAYCDTSTGRWVCNDGTYSPSCTCNTYEAIDNNYNYIETAKTCKEYRDTISKLENKIIDLEEKNKILEENSKIQKQWVCFLIFMMICYTIYRIVTNNIKKENKN